jgi:hypothetical protein
VVLMGEASFLKASHFVVVAFPFPFGVIDSFPHLLRCAVPETDWLMSYLLLFAAERLAPRADNEKTGNTTSAQIKN